MSRDSSEAPSAVSAEELRERLRVKTRVLDAIGRLAGAAHKDAAAEDVFKAVLAAFCEALGEPRAAFFERDRTTGELVGAAFFDGDGGGDGVSGVRFAARAGDDALAKAMVGGGPQEITAAADREGILGTLGFTRALSVGVEARGRVVGIVVVEASAADAPTGPLQMEVMAVVAAAAGVAVDNAMLGDYVQRLEAMASTDPLTSLNNRRNLLGQLGREVERAKRYRKPLTLVMTDIDRFKHFNDTYGHQAGDGLLKMIGKLLQDSCRNIDTPGRLGGEEFLVVLPETTLDEAGVYAERLRSLVEKLGERLKKRYPVHALTISVGITSFNQEEDDLDSFIRRVDNAMYSAKSRGRNRVCAL